MKKLHFIVCCFVFFFSQKSFSQNNIDFEATPPGVYTTSNAVSGWTISSQTATSCNTSTTWVAGSPEFSVLTTPLLNFPFIGTIPNSPLGGNKIARLNNNTTNGLVTKLERTISVSYSNSVLQVAFAAIFEDGLHPCCEQSGFKILFYNNNGNLITCPAYNYGAGGCPPAIGFSTTANTKWTNWQIKYIDLSPYVGTSITIELIANDCVNNDHFGSALFDLQHSPPSTCWVCDYPSNNPNDYNPISYCPGSNLATIQAPYGYAQYSWTAPVGYPISTAQSSLVVLTVTNPVVGNIYTLQAIPPNVTNCIITQTYALNHSTLSVVGIASSSSCIGGANGTATVIASGSGAGYLYAWSSSTNTFVNSTNNINNLSAGIYSVQVTAAGSQSTSCGSALQVFTVGTSPVGVINYLKPFCAGQTLTLTAPGGTNYQWYNNSTAIGAAAGGTASSYILTNPSTGSIYHLTYTSALGCSDSIKFTLAATPPGNISIFNNVLVCPGANNGSALINMTPAQGVPPGLRSFHVYSNASNPPYSASVSPGPSNMFPVNNLSAGQTYSVLASDGLCTYATSFSVSSYAFNYTATPTSATICNGAMTLASVNFSAPPTLGQYSYSWSPSSNFVGASSQNAILLPSFVSLGSASTAIYTVVVTPSALYCPITKTIAITVANPVTPTIVSIPTLCSDAPVYNITVNPAGGTFLVNNNSITQAGLLSPGLANAGINSFTYANSFGSCVAQTTATFLIASTNLSTSTNSTIFCGQNISLSASGANTYQWSNGLTTPNINVAPITSSIYTVIGTNTLNSCSKTNTIQVSVTSSLVVSIAGSNSICLGNTQTLYASGANTYTWNSGAVGPNIPISPSIPTAYTVTGSDLLGCKSSTQIQVFVYPKPIISVTGNFSICPGVETILYAYNAYSYNWNTGVTSNTLAVSPPVTTIYTVTGTDFYGCANTKTVMVVVDGCVGLEENSLGQGINIYPNPTSEKLTIETPGKINLIITDALGKVIVERELEKGSHVLNLNNYNQGIYFVKTIYKGEVKTTKVIKSQ